MFFWNVGKHFELLYSFFSELLYSYISLQNSGPSNVFYISELKCVICEFYGFFSPQINILAVQVFVILILESWRWCSKYFHGEGNWARIHLNFPAFHTPDALLLTWGHLEGFLISHTRIPSLYSVSRKLSQVDHLHKDTSCGVLGMATKLLQVGLRWAQSWGKAKTILKPASFLSSWLMSCDWRGKTELPCPTPWWWLFVDKVQYDSHLFHKSSWLPGLLSLVFWRARAPRRNVAASDVWEEARMVSPVTISSIASQQWGLKDSSLCT